MYIFDHQEKPLLLPVSAGALLRPWFTTAMLDEGFQLIRDNKLSGFSCLRNAVAALIDDKGSVMLQFAKSTTLHQGFFIETRHCGLCRLKTDEKGCAHLAALAIQSLIMPGVKTKALPLPLAFAASNWRQVGAFLHAWLHRQQYRVEQTSGDGLCHWRITLPEGEVRFTLPDSLRKQAEFLLQRRQQTSVKEKMVLTGPALLHDQLQLRTMTDNERLLAKSGNSSIGWQQDSSFWTWLAQMLYALHGDTLPEFLKDPATSRFRLQLSSDEETGSLTLIPPTEKVWEMVRTLPIASPLAAILPSAKECSRVAFTDDDQLEVVPCLRLADGRILPRHLFADQRFSTAQYLDGEGFLPTIRAPAEATINNPASAVTGLPLLGFLQNEKARHLPFSVKPNDIQSFLDLNKQSLRHPDNIVAPEILQLQLRQFPDKLVINAFEEHDDWCYLSCHYGLGNTSITMEDIAAAKGKKLTCLPGREWLQLEGTALSWFHNLPENRFAADGSGKIRLSRREILTLTALIPEVQITVSRESPRHRLTALLDTARWSDDASLDQPPAHLRPYQRSGLAWLYRLLQLGIGGLLADDMGLGKTHQGLALLQMAMRKGEKHLMLVVCPASVVLNWAEKIDGFYPDLRYAVYYGQQRDLEKARQKGVLLTTYGIVRQDLEQLRLCAFDVILLDEIQHLKNRDTAVHQAVAALNGRVKIGLTGTPVENSLQDLRSLFDICLPGLLGSEREFQHNYVQPITEGGNMEIRHRLGRLIHPFILRRSRAQVLTELPDTIEDNRLCQLSDDQISLYREVLKEREEELEQLENDGNAVSFINILATITRLKQICCHPCLVQACHDPRQYSSGKWDLFVELTEELLAADMKFVVFSQYVGMIELIEKYLKESGIGYSSLKGKMAAGKRQKMIGEFNNNPDCRVFCASLLAGGIGIDLTGAQAVIHYDRWWNPAREEQATARVHRMGQKNVVQVFRLITKGTLEEKIHNLIMKKRDLAAILIEEDEADAIKQLDRRQLAELLRLAPLMA